MIGGLVRAWQTSEARVKAFQADVGHGRTTKQTSAALQTRDRVELIYQDIKYSFIVRRTGPHTMMLTLARDERSSGSGASVEAELRTLRDGYIVFFFF